MAWKLIFMWNRSSQRRCLIRWERRRTKKRKRKTWNGSVIKHPIFVKIYFRLSHKLRIAASSCLHCSTVPIHSFGKLKTYKQTVDKLWSKRIIHTSHTKLPFSPLEKRVKTSTQNREKRGNENERKKQINQVNLAYLLQTTERQNGTSVETKYHAKESYFNAWNNANSMWPLHSIFDTKFRLPRKFCNCTMFSSTITAVLLVRLPSPPLLPLLLQLTTTAAPIVNRATYLLRKETHFQLEHGATFCSSKFVALSL